MSKKIPLVITKTAYNKILEIRKQKGIDDVYHLRLGVKAAGCGIASHIIGFDHPNQHDEIFELIDLKIIIEKIQLMYLAGKTVDYGTFDDAVGFVFRENS